MSPNQPPRSIRILIALALLLALGVLVYYAATGRFGQRDTTEPSPAPASAGLAQDAQGCARLAKRLPTVTKEMCEQLGLAPTGTLSVKGFPILARDYPADGKRSRPLRVLLIGGIHGDEPTAAAIVFRWMESIHLPIAHSMEWRVAPVVNPDGLFATPQTRMNANGVDLNRNFLSPDGTQDALQYWQQRTKSDPRRFPGQTPLSEPESRWVHDEIERFQPDVVVSIHAPLGELDFDGSAEPPRRFGRLTYNRIGVYPGSLGNYGNGHRQIPVITIELDNAQQMPTEEEIKRIWRDMVIWMSRNVRPRS
ncbi:MAG: M14 family zinc carboxypeptidase [Burkholderiaceae bacterium]|nr:M14 family zinc carboxypeptidase [Burkholderiaceae bacterium]